MIVTSWDRHTSVSLKWRAAYSGQYLSFLHVALYVALFFLIICNVNFECFFLSVKYYGFK